MGYLTESIVTESVEEEEEEEESPQEMQEVLDLVGRRQLGPRGGRKPKFPTAEAAIAATTHGPASSASCRRGEARGQQRTQADPSIRNLRVACGRRARSKF